jgi:hypothetical protein
VKTLSQILSGLQVRAACNAIISDLKLKQAAECGFLRIVLFSMIIFLTSYSVPGGRIAMTEWMQLQAERDFFYFNMRHKPFSEDLLKECLEFEGIKYLDVVLLQSKLETGYYTSDIFVNGNNLFGMKYPSYRPTIASGTYKGHAKYFHWSDSVIDYALWQRWYMSLGYRIGEDADNDFYLVFLRCIPYAEDPRYVPKLVELSQRDMT